MGASYTGRFRLATYSETCALNSEGRRKFRCPSCGARGSFTPFIDTETGEAIDVNECGRCDHEERCGYIMPPRDYFKKYPDKRPDNGMTKEERQEAWRQRIRELRAQHQYEDRLRMIAEISADPTLYEEHQPDQKPGAELCTLEWARVEKQAALAYSTPFYRFLLDYFDEGTVKGVFSLYHVGGDAKGRIIFWQIDEAGKVRTGKHMKFKENGHRPKLPNGDPEPGSFNWHHVLMKNAGKLPESWTLRQCLFGAHLLNADDIPAPVCLVEAEKTAIIAACAMPQFLWVATGGLQQLKAEMLEPLFNYSQTAGAVTIFADLGDARHKWEAKLKEIGDFLPYTFSDFLESRATPKALEKKMDLADYLLGEF